MKLAFIDVFFEKPANIRFHVIHPVGAETCPYGHADICPCGHAEMCPCGHADICPYGHAETCPYGHVDICPCGHAEMCPYGYADICPCGHAEMCPCGHEANSSFYRNFVNAPSNSVAIQFAELVNNQIGTGT